MAVTTIPSLIRILGAPDYRDWLGLFSIASTEEKTAKFECEIIPHLNDYAEGSLFTNILQANPWLSDFHNPDSNFESTLCEFEAHPNEGTITLANYVKYLAGTIITVAWQENMKHVLQRIV